MTIKSKAAINICMQAFFFSPRFFLIFGFLYFEIGMPPYGSLAFILLDDHWASWICDLVSDITLGKFSVIISNISSVPFSLLLLVFSYMYVIHFIVVPQSLDNLSFFCSLCWFCFSILKVYIEISSNSDSFLRDFPGGTVVKNPPASAGDMGLSPGLGRSHMPWSNKAHEPQLLSLHSIARKPQWLSPLAATTEAHTPRAHAPQQEKPPQWEARAPQRRVAPARHN